MANRGESLVVAGYRQPLAVHLLAHAMNAALGNIGKTVSFRRRRTDIDRKARLRSWRSRSTPAKWTRW